MRTRWLGPGVLALLVATTGVAVAQGRGHNKDRGDHGNQNQDHPDVRQNGRPMNRGQEKKAERAADRFDDHDRQLADNWYYHSRSDLPPGLRDRDRLPPGIEGRFARGYVIEPRYRTVIYPAPPLLVRVLAPPPPGCRYVFFGGRLVLLDPGFRMLDVLQLNINLGR